jgi:hypothetical protein
MARAFVPKRPIVTRFWSACITLTTNCVVSVAFASGAHFCDFSRPIAVDAQMGCNGNVQATSRLNFAVDWFIFGERLTCDSVVPIHVTLALCLTIVRVFSSCDSRVFIKIKIAFGQSERREKSSVLPGRWRRLLSVDRRRHELSTWE